MTTIAHILHPAVASGARSFPMSRDCRALAASHFADRTDTRRQPLAPPPHALGADTQADDLVFWGRGPLYAAVNVNTIPRGGRPDRTAARNMSVTSAPLHCLR